MEQDVHGTALFAASAPKERFLATRDRVAARRFPTRLSLVSACIVSVCLLLSSAVASAVEPAFSIRGVVHGAFGSVWSHAERMDMVRWLGAHRMNTFVYMPNEDVFTRERWREPFPDWTMPDFADEIALARSLGVSWVLGTRPGQPLFADDPSPGQDICFSCDADFELLAAKYQVFHELGARVLMLSFDDVVKVSSHPEDAERFGTDDAAYGRMNAYLANRLRQRFGDSLVVFGPADYSGTRRTEYLGALAEDLSPEIVVYWTGPLSATITAADADAYADAVSPAGGPRRRLLIWDNYPNNDLYGEAYGAPAPARGLEDDVPERAPSLRLNFGPLKGRGADLVGRVEGLISNGMNQPFASKVALYTIAAYLNDPLAYSSEQVSCAENPSEHTRAGCLAEQKWLEGVRELGGSVAGELLNVVNQMRSSKLDRTEAPVFVARRDALVAAFPQPHWEAAWSALVEELRAERDSGSTLRTNQLPSPAFVEESANHLDTLELNTAAGMLAAQMLKPQRPRFESVTVERHARTARVSGRALPADPAKVAARQAELEPFEASARSSPFSVHGDRADPVEAALGLGEVILLENRIDQFLDWVHQTTDAWLPLSALAAAGPLKVTVNGVPVAVAGNGSFSTETTLVPGQKTIELVVTDAAGFRTARRYQAVP